VTGRCFSPVSFTNKTDRHDITEILLKVALNSNTIKQNTHAKSRKSKKKKRKEQDSIESTGTYTLEGQTNMSYKGTEMDMASVKSNGTYSVPELRRSPRTTSRMSSSFTRSRKSRHNRIGVDRVNIIVKTDRHDITEILLKVALNSNTIKQTNKIYIYILVL
jgi:hypothetical protein